MKATKFVIIAWISMVLLIGCQNPKKDNTGVLLGILAYLSGQNEDVSGQNETDFSANLVNRFRAILKDIDGYPVKSQSYSATELGSTQNNQTRLSGANSNQKTDKNGKLNLDLKPNSKTSLSTSNGRNVLLQTGSAYGPVSVLSSEKLHVISEKTKFYHPLKDGKYTFLSKCEYGVGTAFECAGKGSTTRVGAHHNDYIPIAGEETQDVFAIGKGKITKIMNSFIRKGDNDGFGYYVIIRHKLNSNSDCNKEGECVWSFYAHLSEVSSDIQEGQEISPETVIGKMGGTGGNWDNHLHLEILTKDKEEYLRYGGDRSNDYSFGYTKGDPRQYGYLGPDDFPLNTRTPKVEKVTINKDYYNPGERIYVTWSSCRPDFSDKMKITIKDPNLATPESDDNGTHPSYRILTAENKETENDCEAIFSFPKNLNCLDGCRLYVKVIDKEGNEDYAESKIFKGGTNNNPCPDSQHEENGLCRDDTTSCPVLNGTGQKTWNGSSYDLCEVVSCDSGYNENNNQCVANDPGCPENQHKENGVCKDNIISCTITNGRGQKTWNGSGYGLCEVVSCDPGYNENNNQCVANDPGCPENQHKENGVCKDNIISCTVTNGRGQKTWNGSGYGLCEVVSCNSGYHEDSDQCMENEILCPSNQHEENGVCINNKKSCYFQNALSAEQTWSNGIWGSCYPKECYTGYLLQNNQCIKQICTPNNWYKESCSITNGNGEREKKCSSDGMYYLTPNTCQVVSCYSGYTQSGNTCIKEQVCSPYSAQTQFCSINYGSGEQTRTCNSDGSGYNSWSYCKVTSCNYSFTQIGNNCARIFTGSNVTVYENTTGEYSGTLSATSTISNYNVRFKNSKSNGMKCPGVMRMYKSSSCSSSNTDPYYWGSYAGYKRYKAGDNPTVDVLVNSANGEKVCYRVKMVADYYSECEGSTSWSKNPIPVILQW